MVDRLRDVEADGPGGAGAGGERDRPAEEERAALVNPLEATLGVGDCLDRVPRQAGGRLSPGFDADALEVVAEGDASGERHIAGYVVRRAIAGLGLVVRRGVVAAAEQVQVPLDGQLEFEGRVAGVLDRRLERKRRGRATAAEAVGLLDGERSVEAVEDDAAEPAGVQSILGQRRERIRVLDEVAEFLVGRGDEGRAVGAVAGGEHMYEPAPALVAVVMEVCGQARLLDAHHVVDRPGGVGGGCRGVAAGDIGLTLVGRTVDRRLGGFCVVGHQPLVVCLRPAPQDRRQRQAAGAQIPRRDAGTLGQVDDNCLAGQSDQHLVDRVEIRVDHPRAVGLAACGRGGRIR